MRTVAMTAGRETAEFVMVTGAMNAVGAHGNLQRAAGEAGTVSYNRGVKQYIEFGRRRGEKA